jgi:hypothetical protein
MKRPAILLPALLMTLVLTPLTGSAQEEWQKLPKLEFEECVAAERSVQQNPFSSSENDFFVVTTYEEEDGKNEAVRKRKSEARDSAQAFNVYLVLGVHKEGDRPAALVDNIALIMTQRGVPLDGSAGETLRRWIMMDENGDGRLDKAMFNPDAKEATDETAAANEVELSSEQVSGLQGYFEEAVRNISQKAQEDPASTCTPS